MHSAASAWLSHLRQTSTPRSEWPGGGAVRCMQWDTRLEGLQQQQQQQSIKHEPLGETNRGVQFQGQGVPAWWPCSAD